MESPGSSRRPQNSTFPSGRRLVWIATFGRPNTGPQRPSRAGRLVVSTSARRSTSRLTNPTTAAIQDRRAFMGLILAHRRMRTG